MLYRHADALYTLVTDQVFLNEPSVVWERIEDVDQGAAVFVDSAFQRAAPVGGDWAGWTPAPERVEDPAECVFPICHMRYYPLIGITHSRELAMQLQSAEDELAQRARAKREEERLAQRRRDEETERQSQQPKRKDKNKKDNNCSIM